MHSMLSSCLTCKFLFYCLLISGFTISDGAKIQFIFLPEKSSLTRVLFATWKNVFELFFGSEYAPPLHSRCCSWSFSSSFPFAYERAYLWCEHFSLSFREMSIFSVSSLSFHLPSATTMNVGTQLVWIPHHFDFIARAHSPNKYRRSLTTLLTFHVPHSHSFHFFSVCCCFSVYFMKIF